MKWKILLCTIAAIGACTAGSTQSVTLYGKNVPFKKVFTVIKKQTGYGMFANKGLMEQAVPVTIMAENLPLADFLALAFKQQPLQFRIADKIIILSEKKTIETPADQPASAAGITGKISSREGEPLADVSVRVKGAAAGITTNAAGIFMLNRVPEQAVLEISSMGYELMEIAIRTSGKATTAIAVKEAHAAGLQVTQKNGLYLDITLVQAIRDLEETVVIAYGTVKRKDLTGSVVTIKGGDITATPVNNVMEALQGKVAGLDIMRSSGAVGTNADVLLRGNRSIYGDNGPLYIIDGIQGSYTQVNPSDIATIDVLKDASSTALYGSAGSNGVVIITTKKGQANKSTASFDAFYGFSGAPHFFHSMIGDEYLQYRREIYRTNHGVYPQDLTQLFSGVMLDAVNNNKWIDWVALITDNKARQQKYNFSYSGGSTKTRVYTSFTHTREDGLLSNENKKLYGARLNLDHDLATWFKTGLNLNITYSIHNARGRNIFTRSLSALPLGDPYDAYGNINTVFIDGETTPLGDQLPNQYIDNTRNTYANLNVYAEVRPFSGISFRSTIGATLNNSRNGRYWGKQAASNVIPGYSPPLAAVYNGFSYGYTWENVATWNKLLATDHNFGITGITSWALNCADYNNAMGQGQGLDYYQFYNLGNGTQKMGVGSSYEQKQRLSFAGRFTYAFKGRYLLSLTNRWDGVSHLANGHKWSAFPAGSVAWRVSDEKFMRTTIGWLNEMKLRAGYGVTGNAGGMSAYSSQTQAITYQVISLDGVLAPNVQNAGTYSNPAITWERNYNLNIGVDLALVKKRIELSVDWYNTDTKGLLFKRTLPVTAALTSWGAPLATWQNIGATNNKGWEVTLSTVNTNKAVVWNTAFSFTKNTEKIVSLPDGDVVAEKLFQGYPVRTNYDYQYLGIWSTKEEAEAARYGAKPGYVKVATNEKFDAGGVGDKGVHNYTATDRRILGANTPKWLLGINNTITYKNFDLGLFTMIRWGQTINSALIGWYTAEDEGQPAGIDYWTPDNQSAYYPRPGITSIAGIESLRYVDGSFIKLKTITMGYTLPQRIAKRAFMTKGRLYVTAYNPWVYTKNKALKGTDPETGGSDTFPLFATFVFGMNISF